VPNFARATCAPTASDRQRTFARLVYPKLGARQIDDIQRSDIVRLLDKIEDDSGPVMADRTLAYLRKVFNWQASRTEFTHFGFEPLGLCSRHSRQGAGYEGESIFCDGGRVVVVGFGLFAEFYHWSF